MTPRPFPQHCPACSAPRLDVVWHDPIRQVSFDGVVYHHAGCSFYLGERAPYDRKESLAHLVEIRIDPAPRPRPLEPATPPA